MISSNPTAAEKVLYATYLTEANTAYHQLQMGNGAVSIGYNGESVTYTPANKNALKSYINQLRRALGMAAVSNPGMVFKTPVFGGRRF